LDTNVPENTVSYQYSFKVEQEHIDELNHVNNVVYLQWVNNISEQHWNLLATEEIKHKYLWVVLRHELDYLNQAFLGDEITLLTWVGESIGVKSVRHVQVYKGKTILLRARSTWCLLEQKTLRPTRIKEDILSLLRPK
jgi:acyl-CoA thioester hydrolase